MTWPTPPQQQPANYNNLLGGGRTIPSASFAGQFPIKWEGTVEEASKKPAFEYDPSKPNNRGAQKFWPDGNPVEHVWVTLRTNVRTSQEDDGRRVLVLDSKNKMEAVQDAVRESGADFQQGSYLSLEWYGNDPNGKNPQNPPKLYRAIHRGPTLNGALGMEPQTPPTQSGWGAPATPAPQQWGGSPVPAAAPPAPAPQQWGSPAPAAPPATGWGGAPADQINPAAAGWGAPAPAAVAPPAPPAQPDPNEVAAKLTGMGVTIPPGCTLETLMQLAAVYGIQ